MAVKHNTLLTHADAVIGFMDEQYTVSEADGRVNLRVGVLQGTLNNEVVVTLSTNDSTATGKFPYYSQLIMAFPQFCPQATPFCIYQ